MQLTGLQKEPHVYCVKTPSPAPTPACDLPISAGGEQCKWRPKRAVPNILRRGDAGRTHTREILQAVIALGPKISLLLPQVVMALTFGLARPCFGATMAIRGHSASVGELRVPGNQFQISVRATDPIRADDQEHRSRRLCGIDRDSPACARGDRGAHGQLRLLRSCSAGAWLPHRALSFD
jgi:hypothetical protein